jgi:hypothetical protein
MRRQMRRLLVFLALTTGCVQYPVYRVNRTARVPRPAVPLRSGEPLQGPIELSFGASSVGEVRDPKVATPSSSVEVPSTQVRGELRFRVGKRGEFAVMHEQAIATTMRAVDPTQAPVDHGTAWSLGAAVRYAIEIPNAPGFYIGTGLELMQWTIPYVEYRTCIENCDGVPKTSMNEGDVQTYTPGFSLTPTYRTGPVALFAGVYGRRHPTIVRKSTEYDYNYMDTEQDVDGGPMNWVVHAGAEYHAANFAFFATIQQDLTRDPVSYGPSLAVGMSAHLPELNSAPASPSPPSPTQSAPW